MQPVSQFGRDYDDLGSHGTLGARRSGSTLQPASGYQPFTPPPIAVMPAVSLIVWWIPLGPSVPAQPGG
jgi:hypothetical protein